MSPAGVLGAIGGAANPMPSPGSRREAREPRYPPTQSDAASSVSTPFSAKSIHEIQLLPREVCEVIRSKDRQSSGALGLDRSPVQACPSRDPTRAACLEPIPCPLAVVAHHSHQERGDRVAVVSDDLTEAAGEPLRSSARVARVTRSETFSRHPA